jgi:hypothetical protein
MYTVRAIVTVWVFWFVTLQPSQIRHSKRSRPPSIYDLEAVPCLTVVAVWHYVYATWKEKGTNPTRSCMDLVLHHACNGNEKKKKIMDVFNSYKYRGYALCVPWSACGSSSQPSSSKICCVQSLYPSSMCGPALSCCTTTWAPAHAPPYSTSCAIAGIRVYCHSFLNGKQGLVAVPSSDPVTLQSTRYGTPAACFNSFPLNFNFPVASSLLE